MHVYFDTIWEGSPEACQEFNLNIPSLKLEEAVGNDESFVFLSRAEVFDMSDLRIYAEDSRVNPVCKAGEMLSVMEKRVLEYEKGYVIRASHIVSDIMGDVMKIVSKMPVAIRPASIRPVSMAVVDHVSSLLENGRWGGRPRVVHVPMQDMIPLPAIVYRLYEGESQFDVHENGESIRQDYSAAIDSAVFSDVFGADEMIRCIYANRIFVNNEMFGGRQ